MITALTITAMATANPLGRGLAATWDALREDRHGLRPNDFEDATVKTWIGRVEGLEAEPITGQLADFDCRNNRLALAGLREDRFEEAVAAARDAATRRPPYAKSELKGATPAPLRERRSWYDVFVRAIQ